MILTEYQYLTSHSRQNDYGHIGQLSFPTACSPWVFGTLFWATPRPFVISHNRIVAIVLGTSCQSFANTQQMIRRFLPIWLKWAFPRHKQHCRDYYMDQEIRKGVTWVDCRVQGGSVAPEECKHMRSRDLDPRYCYFMLPLSWLQK